MAMTIDAWQKELHREQINLGKIISALKRKKDFKNAGKLEKLRERLKTLAYQPLPAGPGGRMPGVMDPMKFMEYMYPKVNEIVRKIGKNNFDLLIDAIGHSDNPEKLVKTIIAGMPLGGEPNMTRLQQTMHHEQIELDRTIGELQGVRQRLTAGSYTGPRAPSYAAPIPATPQLKKIRRY